MGEVSDRGGKAFVKLVFFCVGGDCSCGGGGSGMLVGLACASMCRQGGKRNRSKELRGSW